MTDQPFDYEDICMGARAKKPKTYLRTFWEDYRLRSLTSWVTLGRGRLLDIGCGGGMIAESLPYYYPKGILFGCDISKTAISYAEKFGSGKVTYDVIRRNRFPYKADFFDVCICLDVLEHVADVDFFLKEVRRVLKKNGTFFLVVPCESEALTYTWLFQKLHVGEHLTDKYFGHIHPEFTHKRVEALLRRHGFSVEKKAYSEHFFYQCMHLLIFFLPKWLLRRFLGEKKAHEYANSSLIRSPKSSTDPFMVIRALWAVFFDWMMQGPMAFETVILHHMPLGAWKLHVLARK